MLRCRHCGFFPGREAADDVTDIGEAESDQRRGREDGRATVIAHEHDLPVEAGEIRVPPCAVGVETPLEDGARNVERTRDNAVALTVARGSDVDDHGSSSGGCKCRTGFQAVYSRSRFVEQLIESTPAGADGHWAMIRRLTVDVHSEVRLGGTGRPPT